MFYISSRKETEKFLRTENERLKKRYSGDKNYSTFMHASNPLYYIITITAKNI